MIVSKCILGDENADSVVPDSTTRSSSGTRGRVFVGVAMCTGFFQAFFNPLAVSLFASHLSAEWLDFAISIMDLGIYAGFALASGPLVIASTVRQTLSQGQHMCVCISQRNKSERLHRVGSCMYVCVCVFCPNMVRVSDGTLRFIFWAQLERESRY